MESNQFQLSFRTTATPTPTCQDTSGHGRKTIFILFTNTNLKHRHWKAVEKLSITLYKRI